MSQYSSTAVPKPKNWQDFENKSSILFKFILNDEIVSMHGRSGQPQQGVDIYGRRDGQDDCWVGVQCKQKDDGKEITEQELRDEVEKAKKFEPALVEFILITTAPDDAKIQKVARELTQTHQKDELFSVNVWGWDTLEKQITRFPEVMEAFHPDLTPFSRRQTALLEESVKLSAESREDQKDIKNLLEQLVRSQSSDDTTDAAATIELSTSASEKVDQHVHKEIDGYRDLLREGDAATAERLLRSLRLRVWDNASGRVRFRITTNIGAAVLEQDRELEAADAFLEAHGYDPDDKIGRANVAFAHVIRGERQQAVVVAEEVLEDDPTNASAAAHLISGHRDNLDLADPMALVPEEVRGSAPVLASAINFLCHRNDDEWRNLARGAMAEFPDEEHLQRRGAEAILDEVLSSNGFKIGGPLPQGITAGELNKSIALMQRMWDQVNADQPWSANCSALAQNLSMAHWVVGQYSQAASVLDQALERDPSDIDLREKRALLHFQAEELDAGSALIGNDVANSNLALAKAQALLQQNPPKARETLDCEAIANASPQQKLGAALLVIDSYVHEGALDQALAHAEAAVQDYDWSLEPFRHLAEVQRRLGRKDANDTLTAAFDKVRPETPFSERFVLATALEEVQRYDDAIAVIEGHADLSYDSPAIRLLISSYINTDRRNSACALLEDIPQEVAEKPFYLRAAAAVHLNRKDFSRALEALDRYLKLKPDDTEMRLQWLGICFRQGQEDRIDAFLADEKIEHSGPPEMVMEIAQWMNQRGLEERALELGYQTILVHSGVPGVHLRYMGLILEPGRSEAFNIDRDAIEEDCAFRINEGGQETWFVIEPDQALRKDADYIDPEHEVASRALGLRSGNEIIWQKSNKDKKWTILEVKHKYIHALHQSMEKFEHRFPGENSLERVPINFEAEEPFEEVFARVKQRHDSIENVFDVLDSGLIPIHLPAKVLGSDIVETRYGLSEAGRRHKVCQGTAPERSMAFEAIRNNKKKGCVVDALTFNVIRRFGLEHTVLAVCGPIHVTGATRDLFWQRVHALESMKKPAGSLFARNDCIYRHETTEDEWNNALKVRKEDLAWIEENATLVPADSGSDAPAEIRKIAEMIDRSFIDDMLGAQGSGMVLLCQDQAYRAIAAQYLGLPTSWLQPVLMIACDEGLIDRDDYNKITISMIEFGDDFVAIDRSLLLAFSDAGSDNKAAFKLAVGCLGGSQADIISHIDVAVGLLKVIWNERPNDVRTSYQTGLTIEHLVKGQKDWKAVIGATRAIYQMRFEKNRRLDSYILRWMKGHFLVPFDTSTLPLAHFG